MEFQGIHSTAVVHRQAKIGNNIHIGPGAIIGQHVILKDHVTIGSYAIIEGRTTIGSYTKVFPHAVIGVAPQDLKYKGQESYIEIGQNNNIREFVTIHPGTDTGDKTIIGSNNLIMAYSHVAHNCVVGNHVVMANCSTLAGHVQVHDHAVIGGIVAVHQFTRIGQHVMIGGMSAVSQDIVPFCLFDGNPGKTVTINSLGLQRRGFTEEQRLILKKAHKILFRENLSVPSAIEKIKKELPLNDQIKEILSFIEQSKRGIAH